MKKLLSVVLALVMLFSCAVATELSASDFSDMRDESHWANDALEAAVDNNLLNGTSAGLLEPESLLTRAQMAAIMVRAFGAEDETDVSQYYDMIESAWYYLEVSQAVQMGIVQGSGSYMTPDDPITREQAFAVLARAFVLFDGDEDTLDSYVGGDDVSSWAEGEVAAMIEAGYVQGDQLGLRPLENITREEFAVLMYRMVSSYVSEPGEYSVLPDGTIVINVAGVTLSNLTITGDLILADGVGEGDIILDNVTITGNLVVRGGGDETGIVLTGGTTVDTVVVAKVTGDVLVTVDSDASVGTVYVAAGLENITVEGSFDALVVDYGTTVYAVDTNIDTIDILAEEGIVILGDETSTGTITIAYTATDAQVIILEDATVDEIYVYGDGAQIEVGDGSVVDDMYIEADNITVSGDGEVLDVDVAEGVDGTVIDGDDVDDGTDTHLNNPTTSTGTTGGYVGGTTSSTKYLKNYIGDLTFTVTANGTEYSDTATTSPYESVVDLTSATGAIAGGVITDSGNLSGIVFSPTGSDAEFELDKNYTIAQFLGLTVTGNNTATLDMDTLELLITSYYELADGDEQAAKLEKYGITIVDSVTEDSDDSTYTVYVSGYLTCSGYSGSVAYTVAFTCEEYTIRA